MPDLSLGLAIVLLLVLGAEFVNGWTDASNAIATVVSTRSLSPFQAVCMASALNLIGVLSGTAVAQTIGKDIIDPGTAVQPLTKRLVPPTGLFVRRPSTQRKPASKGSRSRAAEKTCQMNRRISSVVHEAARVPALVAPQSVH